jgi:hypothetical protein
MHTVDFAKQETIEARLEEIREPLLALLNTKYNNGWSERCAIAGGSSFSLENDRVGVLIELPERPAYYPLMACAIAALLRQSAVV